MESESEPRPCHNQLAVYPLKSTPKVRLQKRQNHTVRDLGTRFTFDHEREISPIARAFRAFMAARSRFAEDRLADAVASGVTQYAVLGAGLDTFAYRNPFPNLRVFESIFPPHRSGSGRSWRRQPSRYRTVSPSFHLILSTRRYRRDWLKQDSIGELAPFSDGWELFPI
jgi:hypothetical protein